MSNNANRFVTVAARRRQAAEEAHIVRPSNKVGGAGKHLLKEARQCARTSKEIARARANAVKNKLKGILPKNFDPEKFPRVARMALEGGRSGHLSHFVRAPERGAWSPLNDIEWLEGFLECHGDKSWWKITGSAWRARVWYMKNVRLAVHATPKFWENLGKVSANVRWAAIRSVQTGAEVTSGWKDHKNRLPWSHRDLKWDEVQKAGRGIRAAAQYVPERYKMVVWKWRFHTTNPANWPPGHWPWNFGPGLEDLVAAAKSPDPWLRHDSQLDAACRLCYWLGDLTTAETLWRRLGAEHVVPRFTPQALHDLAQRFPLRPAPKWWRSIILSAPAQVRPYLRVADKIEAAVKGGTPIPKSISDIRVICEEVGIVVPSTGDLTDVEEEFVNSSSTKLWEELPAVDLIVGSVHIKKVMANDPLLVTAGRLVDCCQHLEGAASTAAEAAWVNPSCGIYVAKKGETVVGQAFAWRGQRGWDGGGDEVLVLDSIECLHGHEASVAAAFIAAAPQMLHAGLGVRKVAVGTTDYGCTDLVRRAAGAQEHPPVMPYEGYSDARRIEILAKITKKGKVKTYLPCDKVEEEVGG